MAAYTMPVLNGDRICQAIIVAIGVVIVFCLIQEYAGPMQRAASESACGMQAASARKAEAESDAGVVPIMKKDPVAGGMSTADEWLNDDSGCREAATTQDETELRKAFALDGHSNSSWVAGEKETELFQKYTLDKEAIKRSVNVRSFGISREQPRYTKSTGASTSVAHQLYGRDAPVRTDASSSSIAFGANDQHWENAMQQASRPAAYDDGSVRTVRVE